VLELRAVRDVRIGEPVIALGSPYGLSGTVTLGIVSGLDRTMPAPNGIPIDNMVQTDALINPGNSGGPLVGFDGAVVGVNDQTIIMPGTGATGLGFAVPADTVRSVYEEICATGLPYVRRASLGVSTGLRAFTGEERARWGQHAGALIVADPRAGGPAAAAGLRRGDVIVAFDGEPVDEPGALYRLLDRDSIGRTCPLVAVRDGRRIEISVVPGERPRPEG
jgi:serine protease Do